MKLKIDWLEKKSEDWKIASVTSPDGYQTKDVSINKVNKRGEAFPNFDSLAPGMEIEAEMWKSPSNKWYLFPPKPQTNAGGAYKRSGGAITAAMEKKEQSIGKFQDNKELGIKMSSTMRMAVDIVCAQQADKSISESEILRWRKWLWEHWDAKDTDFSPFPDDVPVVEYPDAEEEYKQM